MDILILNNTGWGLGGGVEEYSRILADINLELGNRIIKASLNRTRRTYEDLVLYARTEKHIVNIFDNYLEKSLSKVCLRFKIDLIHANITDAYNGYPIFKVSRKLKIPLVFTIHGWNYLCPIGWKIMLPEFKVCKKIAPHPHCAICVASLKKHESRSPIEIPLKITRIPYVSYIYRKLLQDADCVISPSKTFTLELYRELGVKAQYIPNPVNPALLRDALEPRVESIRKDEEQIVLFIGRLVHEKGVLFLPEIARRLNPKAELHVAGTGPLEEKLMRYRMPNMILHGLLFGEEKKNLLKRASVVIVPSVCREMLPYVILEAFVHRKPVVAFDVEGGQKELIEMTGSGLLAKPFDIQDFADKVNYLLQNPDEVENMTRNVHKVLLKEFTIDNYKEKLARIYNNVVS
ncbi:glycosyltransferase family 4 protein [Thermosphaera chiliense]|uniref:Glycosyltransferase family 4 protein n=1 Tax=Thermosphaera chiliense TaxID=3402707 RepID=A0A7M1URJ0_9CREN|nr:glycosyltransferase family 4 protein [Thermosphaera aggregans]QOR94579.1 glycosyltransferase family 4 protein [Thermosphaera aggregans]